MNIKRFLLSLTLLTAFISGCEKVEDPDPLIVTPTGPQASFTFTGGTTYTGRPGYVEYLYSNNPVIQFNNTSDRATSYSWHFGDGKVNPAADTVSTEMNPTHKYTKPGLYVVTLIATLDENGTTRRDTVSHGVLITHARRKLVGKYSMTDTLSKVNQLTVDSVTAGSATTPSRVFSKPPYDLTITVNGSDSVTVDVYNLSNVVKSKKAALVDNSATAQGFSFSIPDFAISADETVTDITGYILKNTQTLTGSNLRLKYKIKNTATNKTIAYHGTGKRL